MSGKFTEPQSDYRVQFTMIDPLEISITKCDKHEQARPKKPDLELANVPSGTRTPSTGPGSKLDRAHWKARFISDQRRRSRAPTVISPNE